MNDFRLVSLVLVILVRGNYQEEQVTNTKLDIVFLLDQGRTNLTLTGFDRYRECKRMPDPLYFCYEIFDYFGNSSNYRMAYDGVKNWVQSFFDKAGSSDAKFAVIFSCDHTGGIMHNFMDGNFENKIPSLLVDGKNGINKVCKKNLKWMMSLANNEIFTAGRGHLPGSSAIAIVLSDCVHEQLPPSEIDQTNAEFRKFFQKTKGHIYFVCYVEFKYPFRDYFRTEIKQFMNDKLGLLRLNNQTNRSMIYLDGHSVDVGQRLDQLLPKRSWVKSTNCNQTMDCGICSGNGTCYAHCNWTTHSWPTGNGTNCTDLAPSIQNCTCPTPQPNEPPSYWPIILGFGILLLVLIALVICFFCVRAKNNRNKRAKNKAVAVQRAPQKKEDIAVDLSREQSKTDTMGQGSKVKSVSMKGSMVKSISKRRFLVKSLAKTGSVSRAVDENVKSISKPKREESKSKASKSVAGKNMKSVGMSKKSVTSKSFATKSQLNRKKPAVN